MLALLVFPMLMGTSSLAILAEIPLARCAIIAVCSWACTYYNDDISSKIDATVNALKSSGVRLLSSSEPRDFSATNSTLGANYGMLWLDIEGTQVSSSNTVIIIIITIVLIMLITHS